MKRLQKKIANDRVMEAVEFVSETLRCVDIFANELKREHDFLTDGSLTKESVEKEYKISCREIKENVEMLLDAWDKLKEQSHLFEE